MPKSWLEYFERIHGVKIKEVAIEVDQNLIITPIIPEREDKSDG
ncbi:MAG: hypothetical protein ACTSUS_04585 [Candidatus Freyarchaeota archaeon]